METTMHDNTNTQWLADEMPARLAEAQAHQQSANQIQGQVGVAELIAWSRPAKAPSDRSIKPRQVTAVELRS